MRDKIVKDERGAILLLSLLVMSGVLIVGASLGTISLLSLRQSRIIDDVIMAFAAAESGAEQTLYQIRRVGETAANLDDENANEDGESTVKTGPAMTNGTSWQRSLSNSEPTLFTSIPKDRAYEVLLWNPGSPASPAGVESMTFAWDDDCGGTSGIEVLAAGWDPVAVGGFDPTIGFHGNSPSLTFLKIDPQVIDNDFTAALAYRVRIRAKNCDIFNMAISAYSADNASGSLVQIPSRIAIVSNGSFGNARQGMELRLPRLQPLTGIFDYVIFSQCSILKGVTGPVCP